MNAYPLTLCDIAVEALPSGGLHLPEKRALVVSDLHLGRAERVARREGRLIPPYETRETLDRLDALIAALRPKTVICLGDSFDDDRAAASIPEAERSMLSVMAAGRRWIWIAGNHDPAPVGFGGESCGEFALGGLTFRHEAQVDAAAEVSGHYHPKIRLRGPGRPAFLVDDRRIVMPAFGAYTGGLDVADPAFDRIMGPEAIALITGRKIIAAPRAPMVAGLKRSA
ncbi:MAG: ligase-associated DNA damage response endonuclease PdeM [Pseudomonadota bacterium]